MLIHAYALELSSPFEQENFRFYGTVPSGTPQMRPRWKRMLDEEELYLGDTLGTVNKKVGNPEKWKDYSSLDIDRGSFVANCMRGRVWHSEYEIQKLHKPS